METTVAPSKEKRRNSEKRKEKSRDAARCRRSKESEIFSDLASVLPLPTSVVTHLDKASVMRLVIANLRIMNMCKAMGLKDEESLKKNVCDQFYLQATGGIVLVISLEGDVIYVSNNVSTYLGVLQVDLLGQSFFDLIHPCDHQDIRDLLSGKVKMCGQVSVFVRVKCAQSSKGRTINLKAASYKVLHIVGRFLKIDESPKERFGFVTIATPIPHPVDIEAPLGSYTFLSKHSLDMKFTYADEKMTEFLGYNPDDLIGESMYNFHHVEDNREIAKSFKSLFEKGQSETCQYRFMAQGGGYIWVCTQATVLYCEKKNIPVSVVCVNYVISGKFNEKEICSREQLEWIKENNTSTAVDLPDILVNAKVEVTELVPGVIAVHPHNQQSLIYSQPPSSPHKNTVPVPSPLITVPVKLEQASPSHSSRPRPATFKIFAPKTADMKKGFLMFPDDDSGVTVLKEEPEDLTHLAPTAGDVCVPLSLDDAFTDIFTTEEYSPLINQDKDTPFFTSYNSNNSSRSLSPALSQSPSSYSGGGSICMLKDDGTTTLEETTMMKSLLDLDLVEPDSDPDKNGFMDLSGSNGFPLLTTSDFPWVVSPPASPSQNYSMGLELRADPLADISTIDSILQLEEDTVLKKCCNQNDSGNTYLASPPVPLVEFDKRKRLLTVQEESVKKRKHGPLTNDTTSVLMNLLIEGHDVTTGYTCYDSRTINPQGNTQSSCLSSVIP